MLQLNTLVRFIHSHSPARLSKFKKILACRPKSVPTPGLQDSSIKDHILSIEIIILMKLILYNTKGHGKQETGGQLPSLPFSKTEGTGGKIQKHWFLFALQA